VIYKLVSGEVGQAEISNPGLIRAIRVSEFNRHPFNLWPEFHYFVIHLHHQFLNIMSKFNNARHPRFAGFCGPTIARGSAPATAAALKRRGCGSTITID
jgi:hypothetical protein